MSGETGSQTKTVASATATGVVAGDLTRSSGLTAVSGSGSINASGWPTAATRDTGKYFTVTITPPHGCALDLTALSVDDKASASGPASASVATSADNFAATTTLTTNASTSPTIAGVANLTGPLEIRVYGFAAGAATGTMRLQTHLVATGSIH